MQSTLKLLLAMTNVLIALNRPASSWARSLGPPVTQSLAAGNSNAMSFALMDANESLPLIIDGVNGTLSADAYADAHAAAAARGAAESHVKRRRSTKCPKEPTHPNVIHLPCDFDSRGLTKFIEAMPDHCICAYNARYSSEEAYRNFKILELEAFFFGQYEERLKRFETNPHQFDYLTL